ncbi:transposable element Tcb2 transposase [Trichonephila clavipes]|uniref:Transposable element Tcb2 transposase n=1 Tax=Trichonephila clavipes TaxID=2585209 RepID=A0A8X6SVF0_TRICX|nr:transposable element Tcb2 transposase [Trichonephila clavipes]
MPLRRLRRQYQQLSEFDRSRINGMMEIGWSALRVARELGRSDVINQVVFSDESRLNLSSDANRVPVWRPLGGRLNPAFALQPHTAPTAGIMDWRAIAYDTPSPLILIHDAMTAQPYVHGTLQPHVLPLMAGLPGAIFQ